MRSAYHKHAEDDDFGQPRTLIDQVLSDSEREALITNIVGHASNGVTPEMHARVVEYWRNIHDGVGGEVEKGLANGRAPQPGGAP